MVLHLLIHLMMFLAPASAFLEAKPGWMGWMRFLPYARRCPRYCDGLKIPYPFGMSFPFGHTGCYQPGFEVLCFPIGQLGRSIAFLSGPSLQLLDISLIAGEVRVSPMDPDPSRSNLKLFNRTRKVVMVSEWAIGDRSCDQVRRDNASSTLCGRNAYCYDPKNGPGYRCNCSEGFRGNPYLLNGCQDIDECKESDPCTNICFNRPGGYSCACPPGKLGNGRRDGSGCFTESNDKKFPWQVILGVGFGFLFLLIVPTWLYWALKKRRLIKLKEKFFQQNGGLLLQQHISSYNGTTDTTKIFTAEELARATDNYKESQILGQGGFGIVYKGTLLDNKLVAIKKSKIADETQVEQFINEVVILSQINHRNVVKLLGCCLETEVPLLVYEFISNGTLSHHIHDEGMTTSLSWENRLRIAAETSGALSYLHSAASPPIFHRDVKSANILLDDNYTAKVSDFGASRSVPFDQTHVTTLVRGTFGYLDPQYFRSSQLTDKSDVYSLGVVLVELLTGEKPISYSRSLEERNLANHFISSMEGNRLFEILEARVVNEGSRDQLIAISKLANQCLSLRGEDRPTMKEVASELEGWRRFQENVYAEQSQEENNSLLDEPLHQYNGVETGQESVQNHDEMSLTMPR